MRYLTAPTILIRKKLKSVEQALDSWMEFLEKKFTQEVRKHEKKFTFCK